MHKPSPEKKFSNKLAEFSQVSMYLYEVVENLVKQLKQYM